MGNWYYEAKGETKGPIPSWQLRVLASEGRLSPTDLVWREGLQHLKTPASTIKRLFDPLPAAPTPSKVGDASGSEVKAIEPMRDKSPPKPQVRSCVDINLSPTLIAEVTVTYREGHPELEGPILGLLCVQSTGLCFLVEDDEKFYLPFDEVRGVSKPMRGDFPQAMKRAALGSKIGGVAGNIAAGVVGNLIGGVGGDLVASAGKQASKMASKSGDLGKPPKNRIAIYARVDGEWGKICFDADGVDRNDMNSEARSLHKAIQEAHESHHGNAREDREKPIKVVDDEEEEESSDEVEASASALAALVVTTPDKPFRVMSRGRIRGPYSHSELRHLIRSGQLKPDVLIGFETWVPLATMNGFVSTSAAGTERAGGGGSSALHPAVPTEDNNALLPVDETMKLS